MAANRPRARLLLALLLPLVGSSAAEAAGLAATELPRGGRELLPRHRIVAFYGGATTPVLGVLGEGTPTQAAQRLARVARRAAVR